MTLFEMRQAGLCVGGERAGQVLIRCGCGLWMWVFRSRAVFAVRHGHRVRCRRCYCDSRQRPATTNRGQA